jgi:hypothetical protein
MMPGCGGNHKELREEKRRMLPALSTLVTHFSTILSNATAEARDPSERSN